jgi:hypothetical protein
VLSVDVDVRPGSVNLSSGGMLSTVVFTTATFNASRVDVSTIEFAGARASISSLEDVDADGDLDLILHFRREKTNLLALYTDMVMEDLADGRLDSGHQAADVLLTGATTDGKRFEGSDTVDLFLAGRALRDFVNDL